MKKNLSIVLAALMLISCVPLFVSAATISLDRKNVEIIPPTVSPAQVNYGEGIANVTVSGGQLWYVDADGNKTEVKGYFEIRNKATVNPRNAGDYKPGLLFYPEDTATYGEVSGSLSHITLKNKIVSGEWPVIYVKGTATQIVTPPSFTCDAGDSLASYPNYTKTGGKVIDENGNNVTSSGQFYIDEAASGQKNQYLYEDTYVTARWSAKSDTPYEDSYYENVLVKVTRKKATLETEPSIPAVLAGTTYSEAVAKLTARVSLKGTKTATDTSSKYWVPVYPEGCNADTPLTEDTTITVKYENPATDDTFTCQVDIDTYSKPLALIKENPVIDATALKPGMKYSLITLTGGKAVKEGTETEITGVFSVKYPDKELVFGSNRIEILFTPDDTNSFDSTTFTVTVSVQSLLTAYPTLDATGLKPGDKASQIKLSGGEANEEGVFSIVDTEQVLIQGKNGIKVRFTPSADGAEYYQDFIVNVTVKDNFRFLDKDGNETVPVYTITYGTRLNDSNTNVDKILAQTGCTLNATSKYTYRAPEGRNCIISKAFGGEVFPVGEHIFKVRVMNHGYTIYDDPPYINTELQFIIKVEPVEMNVRSIYYNSSSEQIVITIDNVGAKGTLDVYVDGVLIADDVATGTYGMDNFRTAKIDGWKPTVSDTEYNRDYSVKVVYNPVDADPVSMKDYEGTFRTKISIPVTAPENITSVSDAYTDGARVECYCPNYIAEEGFVQWYFTDLKGNELDLELFDIVTEWDPDKREYVEVGTKEAAITERRVYFTMPNFPVVVSYKTQAMLDAEAKQEAIDNCNCICHHNNPVAKFLWKIISFFMDLFGIDNPCACTYPHGTK